MSRRKLPFGDPYGARTRVSAVERESAVESTSVAPLGVETGARVINDLRGEGQNLAQYWFSPACVSGSRPAKVGDATKRRIAQGVAKYFGGDVA